MSDMRSEGGPALGLMEMLTMLAADRGDAAVVPEQTFDDLDELMASFEGRENTISRIEGPAVHLGDGILGLPRCPFAGSFVPLDAEGKLPEFSPQLRRIEARAPRAAAAVGPFCHVHQALRWACSRAVTVGGRRLAVYQLGCRSSGGEVALASRQIAELGIDVERVRDALADHMCCYCVRLEDE